MSDEARSVELDPEAVEKAARAMLAEWDREGGEGFDPISWEDINEDDDGAQDSWRLWATVALAASGIPAERDEWKKRTLAAEEQVDTLARELGAREASEWPGVVEGWKARAEAAEERAAVMEKRRNYYAQRCADLAVERDLLQAQVKQAGDLVRALAISWEGSLVPEDHDCEDLFESGLIATRRDYGDEYVTVLTLRGCESIQAFLSSTETSE